MLQRKSAWRRTLLFWSGMTWYACPEWGRAYLSPKKSLLDLLEEEETPTLIGVGDKVVNRSILKATANVGSQVANVGLKVTGVGLATVADVSSDAVLSATSEALNAMVKTSNPM